jgi:hypothetical protein
MTVKKNELIFKITEVSTLAPKEVRESLIGKRFYFLKINCAKKHELLDGHINSYIYVIDDFIYKGKLYHGSQVYLEGFLFEKVIEEQ